MFERWTVDAVTGEIERQIKGAAPTPRLVRRYYKHGRKHGRTTQRKGLGSVAVYGPRAF